MVVAIGHQHHLAAGRTGCLRIVAGVPHHQGLGGHVHIDRPELAAELAAQVGRSAEDIAEGCLKIAVQQMANAIKKISVARGYDVTRYTLQCFGGAGGQHACQVADALGMPGLKDDPLYRAQGDRVANRARINAIVGGRLAAEPTARWVEVLNKAGVPCVPGSGDPLGEDNDENLRIAKEIGYPVIIKASGGGGGRLMYGRKTSRAMRASRSVVGSGMPHWAAKAWAREASRE